MHAEQTTNDGFLGRREELQALYQRACAAGTGACESVLLAGSRGTGKTALLRHFAGYLFWKQDRVVPFLYPGNAALLGVADFSRDYLAAFLRQRLAFERRDQALLSTIGIPLRELAARAGDQGATWAWELIERFQHCADDPLTQLQTALHAPARSVAETGKPVIIMVDDFPMLAGLHRAGDAEPALLALFHGPVTTRLTPHVLAGDPSALRDLPLPVLTEIPLPTLPPGDAAQLFQAALKARAASPGSVPQPLLDHLNGNPLYLRRVAGAVAGGGGAGEEAFWTAYINEVTGGGLYHYLAGPLRTLFPRQEERRNALEALRRVYSSGREAAVSRAVHAFVSAKLAPGSLQALLRLGLVCGEFGGYRAPDDGVLRDFVILLYEREIEGRSPDDIMRRALAGRSPAQAAAPSWDLSVPLAPRAELVIAESLEQIGKNLHIAEDTIGQLQLAVIEACINAIEHTKGGDRRLAASIRAFPDRLEVSVESPGQEFVQAETGEPLVEDKVREGPTRGQGIRLMKRFADAVRFERTPHGTHVVLVKYMIRSVTSTKEGIPHGE